MAAGDYAGCVQKVVDAAGGTISKQEAEEILQELADEAERLKREGQAAGADERLREFAKAAGERKKIEAALAKKHAVLSALNFQKRRTHRDRLKAAGLSYLNAFRVFAHGMSQRAEGVRDSAQETINAYRGKYAGTVMALIGRDKGHLERMFKTGWWSGRPTAAAEAFGERLIKEMETPGSTKDADAGWLAKLFSDVAEVARRDGIRLGAFIGKLKDQGWFPHSHDADRIIKVSQRQWVDDILAELDVAKTYKGRSEEAVRKHLNELYDTITTGKDLSDRPRSAFDAGFKAPPNLAKRLGEERFLIFKNSDAWIRYNRKYGKGNALSAMFDHLNTMARYNGLMDYFGPNPGATLARLADDTQRLIRADSGLSQKQKRDMIRALDDVEDWGAFRVVFGKHAIPESERLAKVGAAARSWEVASKLMAAVLSSAPTDPVTSIGNLRFQGKPLLESWAQLVREYLRGRGSTPEMRHLAFLYGEGYESLIEHALTPYSAADSLVGRFARIAHQTMKWQGMTGFTDIGKAASARVMAADAGHHLGFEWANLPIRYRNTLELQGIDERQWLALRQARHRASNGSWYLSPDNIAKLPDHVIDPLIRDRLDDAEKAVQLREQQIKDADAREAEWVQKRTDKFLERFQRSRDYLEGLRSKMDEAAQKRTDALQERIDGIGERLSEVAEAYDALAGRKKPGISRRVGRDEGKLGERTKNLAKDIKAIEREVQSRSGELGKRYLDTWQKWQGDLQQFVERIEERQKARAAEAKELPDRLTRRVESLRETARNDLEIAWRRFVSDEVGYAIPEPDARTTKWTTWGGKRSGTPAGEVARSVMQMKGFPISFTQRPLDRGLRSGPDYGSRAANIMHTTLHMGEFMAMLFVAGLMAAWMKDISRGKSRRSLVDEDGNVNWKTIGAAFMQGGGAGIYSDFLFSEANRFGGGLFETMGGPLVGAISDLAGFLESVRNGEPRASRAMQLVLGNTPFINFWATRAALDYLFLSSLREWASPGYLARQEKKMREDYGQERMAEPLRPFG